MPSVLQIQQYVKELNGLESRRGRKPLDVNNVVYWFKNARAAQKRAELRGIGPGECTEVPHTLQPQC
jgi:homeobox domain-containing protein